jgi:hypothetical protein
VSKKLRGDVLPLAVWNGRLVDEREFDRARDCECVAGDDVAAAEPATRGNTL